MISAKSYLQWCSDFLNVEEPVNWIIIDAGIAAMGYPNTILAFRQPRLICMNTENNHNA